MALFPSDTSQSPWTNPDDGVVYDFIDGIWVPQSTGGGGDSGGGSGGGGTNIGGGILGTFNLNTSFQFFQPWGCTAVSDPAIIGDTVVFTGHSYKDPREGVISTSTDGGKTWTLTSLKSFMGDAYYAHGSSVCAVDGYFYVAGHSGGSDTIILKSLDGLNWEIKPKPALSGIPKLFKFGGKLHLFAATTQSSYFYVSNDGGNTWDAVTPKTTYRNGPHIKIAFSDGSEIFSFGSYGNDSRGRGMLIKADGIMHDSVINTNFNHMVLTKNNRLICTYNSSTGSTINYYDNFTSGERFTDGNWSSTGQSVSIPPSGNIIHLSKIVNKDGDELIIGVGASSTGATLIASIDEGETWLKMAYETGTTTSSTNNYKPSLLNGTLGTEFPFTSLLQIGNPSGNVTSGVGIHNWIISPL